MSLERRLGDELILQHPERAAVALERVSADEAAELLSRVGAQSVAKVVRRMSPDHAVDVLERLEPGLYAAVLEVLPVNAAARLIRRASSQHAERGLASVNPQREAALRSLMRFPEDSAGALMDPEVLALSETLSASEAMERIRTTPQKARYNVYVVDTDQRLVGVVNLREIMLASPTTRLADFMVRGPRRLDAASSHAVVVSHPGWDEVHSLPVVDEDGGYLGAIRYRTRRRLEAEMRRRASSDADAREALGQLFSAGAVGVLDAMSTPRSQRGDGG